MMNMEKEVYGLVDEWLGTVEYRVARSTYVKYEQLARNYILPFFHIGFSLIFLVYNR